MPIAASVSTPKTYHCNSIRWNCHNHNNWLVIDTVRALQKAYHRSNKPASRGFENPTLNGPLMLAWIKIWLFPIEHSDQTYSYKATTPGIGWPTVRYCAEPVAVSPFRLFAIV